MNLEALKALGITGLRGLALGLGLSGNAAAAAGVNKLADGVQSGADIDADMQVVADLLKAGKVSDADWDAAFAELRKESEDLRGP